MTAGGETCWHEFAKTILEEASRTPQNVSWFAKATSGQPFLARRVTAVTTPEFPTPARRPAYSILSNSLLLRTFGTQLPDWMFPATCSAFTAS